MISNSPQLNTPPAEVAAERKWRFTVGRIFLWFSGALVLILLLLVGGRTWHYYRLIKSGKIVDLPSYSFTQSSRVNVSTVARQNLISETAPSIGSPEAKITIVEFADFQCPYSKEVFTAMRELVEKNKDEVRLIFRHYPLSDIHPEAVLAAEAGECAKEQDKFWAMHDKLFQNQSQLKEIDLINYAGQIGLDGAKFNECLTSHKFKDRVLADYQAGFKAGVAGTPTFFINGYRAMGAIPLFEWEKIIKLF